MTDTLFTSQIPALPDVNETAPVSVANTCVVTAAGTSSNARFYGPVTIGAGTYAADLYALTGPSAGALIASAVFVAPVSSVWNTAPWAGGAVALATNTAYKIVLRSSAGRYAAQGAFWTSALVSGNITGIQDGSNPVGIGALANGTFVGATAGLPPNGNTFNSNGYWVDFDHTASGGGGGAAPSGLGIPAVLGTPTAALGRTAAPAGLSVPVALGSPSAGNPISPSGLAVPVGLGSPSTSGTVVSSTPVSAGWYGLLAIGQENYSYRREERMRPPVACPNDGEPLRTGPDGELYCPWDGWQWQGPRV